MNAPLRLTTPLPTLQAWTDAFARAEIPVLAETAEALELLRANEDDVDAHGLAELIATDPLMTLKVLAHASELRRGHDSGFQADAETVTAEGFDSVMHEENIELPAWSGFFARFA